MEERSAICHLWSTVGEIDLAHALLHNRLPILNLLDERRINIETTHDVPDCNQLLDNKELKEKNDEYTMQKVYDGFFFS